MWSVQNLQNGQRYHFLIYTRYTVGRKGNKIMILDDPSISEFHAFFMVSMKGFTLSRPSVLRVTDAGSTCGTFVNGNRITAEKTGVQVNDIIKFGTSNSEFIVCHEPLVVCTSALDDKKKEELRSSLFQLGGQFSEEWMSDCTHLVMPRVTISVKAITALVSLRPLVGLDFFPHLVECWTCRSVERRLEEKCYIPPFPEMQPCEETSIFNINMDRTTIFQDKSFFFLEENQFKKLQFIILTAGGRTTLLKKNTQFNPELLVGPDACIVKPSMEIDKLLEPFNISDLLSSNKKRLIPEFDIAMAVIYCSTAEFCNPAYNSDSATCDETYRIASQKFSDYQIFAENTEEVIQTSPPREKHSCFQNPTPGTSKDAHIDVIEIEESQDGLPEKKKNSDHDDIICEYSSIEKQSSKKKTEADDSDDEPEFLLAKLNVPDLKKRNTDGNNFESKESRISPRLPPCIDISDDDLPTVSQDKISSKEIKERSTMECQESELNGFSTFRNLNMSPQEINEVECEETESAISNDGENLNMSPQEINEVECEETESAISNDGENLNMSPQEINEVECEETESAISNDGENLNVHPNVPDCQTSGEEPSSLTNVQFANLVKRTASEVKENAACNEDQDISVRNFKRFKTDNHDSEEGGEF